MDDKKKAIVHETRPQGLSEQPHGHDHEHSDIVIRPIFMAFIVLMGVTVLAAIATWGLFEFAESRHMIEDANADRSPMMDTLMIPPMPRLQVNEKLDMRTYLDRQDSILSSTGVVDSASGVMRIPIDSAMAIVARRGMAREQDLRGRQAAGADTAMVGRQPAAGQTPAQPSDSTR